MSTGTKKTVKMGKLVLAPAEAKYRVNDENSDLYECVGTLIKANEDTVELDFPHLFERQSVSKEHVVEVGPATRGKLEDSTFVICPSDVKFIQGDRARMDPMKGATLKCTFVGKDIAYIRIIRSLLPP